MEKWFITSNNWGFQSKWFDSEEKARQEIEKLLQECYSYGDDDYIYSLFKAEEVATAKLPSQIVIEWS